jgi:hypothetical protein
MATIRGGDRMTAYLRDLSRKVSRGAALKVGFLEGATYEDGTPVATIAAIQNWGAPSRGIPPRPFFTNMVRDKSDGWGPALGRIMEANDFDARQSLALMGEGIAGQLRQSIVDTNSPPLAQSTIDRKGFSKPLIDTSHMLNSIDYEVSP